jgi:phosphatidylserine/phosphatidylglycerophosphate/cardiolipin synthase-like enzyme
MFDAGVPVRCAFQFTTYHNKTIVTDALNTLTGSANFTYQAENCNAENISIIEDGPTAAAYTANFTSDWSGALPYVPPRPHA